MKNEHYPNRSFSLIHFFGLLGGMTLLILLIAHSAMADYELPPRENIPDPETEPITQQSLGVDVGGRVHLRVLFHQTWPWSEMHWQEDLWHVIEWHDHAGTWYQVEGWQGHLETIQQEGDRWVGQKELWVSDSNLGAGPFRWMIYNGSGGSLLATSPEFYLPSEAKGMVKVELELMP